MQSLAVIEADLFQLGEEDVHASVTLWTTSLMPIHFKLHANVVILVIPIITQFCLFIVLISLFQSICLGAFVFAILTLLYFLTSELPAKYWL